jgi:hypothetical protein
MQLRKLKYLLKELNYIKMGNRKEIIKELEEIAPLLNKIKKPEKAGVPVMYFEGFSDRLVSQMDFKKQGQFKAFSQDTVMGKIWLFFAQPRYVIATATSIVLLVTTIFLLPKDQNKTDLAMNLSQEEVGAYITQHIDQFEMKTLIDEDLTETDVNSLMEKMLPQDEVDKEIEENIDNINIEDLL